MHKREKIAKQMCVVKISSAWWAGDQDRLYSQPAERNVLPFIVYFSGQNTAENCIGGHVNVFSVYKKM